MKFDRWVVLSFLCLILSVQCARTANAAIDTFKERAILGTTEPSNKVMVLANKAFEWAKIHAQVKNDSVITIVDFSLPSYQKRAWIIDRESGKVLYNFHVSQGKNTGLVEAKSFSNAFNTLKSSPGIYTTGSTYIGKHGLSLHLNGLEKGINDNAYKRTIVVHPAWYMTEAFIKQHGYAGRSWGCFAVSPEVNKDIINLIKGESVLFAYKPGLEHENKHLN